MFTTSRQRPQMINTVLLATALTCAGYWVGFSEQNNEHDPINAASFYMEIGN